MRRLAAVALVLIASACGGRLNPAELPPATGPPAPASSGRPASPVAAAGDAPIAARAPLPPAAQEVASSYAAAASSYRFDAGPSAWIDAVAAICTPPWVEVLRAGTGAVGDWSAIVERREVAVASVLGVYPARDAGGVRRAVVAVRVEVVSGPDGAVERRSAAVELDLVRSGGRWLVAGAG